MTCRLGFGFGAGRRGRLPGVPGATPPAAFTAGQWAVADAATGGQATVTISALPLDGGSAITALQYSIAGGPWQNLTGTGIGARTIGGFANGSATNVNIRAVNAAGAGATSDTKQVTTSGGATAPAAFTAGQWSVANAATDGQADVTISALPANGGSVITALQYSIAGGGWTAFSAATTGTYRIGGFTNGSATNVNIRAVNAIGASATSDTKQVITSAASTAPAAFTAGQWGVVNAGTGQASINILVLPANGGSALTALQYRIGAGAWTNLPAASTGSYTVGGFVDGASTPVLVRAVNSIGSGPDSDSKSVTTSPLGAPAAFSVGMWNVVAGASGQARIDIFSHPNNRGMPITGLRFRIGAGVWTDLSGFGAGQSYIANGFTNGSLSDVQIAAVFCGIQGAASDVKQVTTAAGAATVANQTAPYGAKTLQNGGCFRPFNSLGQPVDLTTTPAPVLVSGSLGAYVPTITTTGPGTGLTFNTGGAGAPNGAVVRVALAAGGTVDLTIATVANEFHVASLPQANTAYGSATCVLGDTIRIRAGDYNMTPIAQIILNRATSPSGAWTGGSDLTAGNWVTITREAGRTVRIGAWELGGSNTHPRYLRVHDLDFLTGLEGNTNGGKTSVLSAQLSLYSSFSSTATMAATNNRFAHTSVITGENCASNAGATGPLVSLLMVGGPYWIEGNVSLGSHTGINANTYNSSGAPPILRRNVVLRAQIDGILVGQCSGLRFEGSIVRDKVSAHFLYIPTAATSGATTVFTVPSSTNATVGELVVFDGFTGDYAVLNRKMVSVTAVAAGQITVSSNTTGLTFVPGGTLRVSSTFHGDPVQFTENNGLTANQVDVQFRGNMITRGYADGHHFYEGIAIFAGDGATTSDRTNWVMEGNLLESCATGVSIAKLVNSMVRSNTLIRPLDIDGQHPSTNAVAQLVIASGSGNTFRDNVANAYSLGGTAIENTNNHVASLTSPTDGSPPSGANSASYISNFVNPPLAIDFAGDPWEAYRAKATGGAQGSPAIVAGHAAYFNPETLVYSNPR